MKFPDWWKAPEEILDLDGHCGVLAAWQVLAYFGKDIPTSEITKACRHTKKYGVFTVNLAAGLKELGLQVSFHSEADDEIEGFERRGYARAQRLGVTVKSPLGISDLLRQRKRGCIPIVLFQQDADSDAAHFSPVIGMRDCVLNLPLARDQRLPADEFFAKWSAPKILKQCVIVSRRIQLQEREELIDT